jgi:outer membrane protein OmpA-like peptidoglycan-associated protein
VAPLPPPPGVPPPAATAAPPAAAPVPASRAPVVIAFAEGSAAVPGVDRPRLDGLAAAARQGGTVRIVSQATPAGGGTMGQLAAFGLALDRANAVAQVLTAAGVPSERILVEAAPPADRPGRAEVSLLN